MADGKIYPKEMRGQDMGDALFMLLKPADGNDSQRSQWWCACGARGDLPTAAAGDALYEHLVTCRHPLAEGWRALNLNRIEVL